MNWLRRVSVSALPPACELNRPALRILDKDQSLFSVEHGACPAGG
jgi:hypothetical protein